MASHHAPGVAVLMGMLEGEQPSTLFVYDQVTPSVKAGRRFRITRKVGRGDYEAEVTGPVPPRADRVDLEGKNGALWTAHLVFTPSVGEELRFTLDLNA